jgi:hypothetical protein
VYINNGFGDESNVDVPRLTPLKKKYDPEEPKVQLVVLHISPHSMVDTTGKEMTSILCAIAYHHVEMVPYDMASNARKEVGLSAWSEVRSWSARNLKSS